MKTNAEKLKDRGYVITSDTIIIEIANGTIHKVHNDPNGYCLFNWDRERESGDENTEKDFRTVLELMLKTLDNPNL